MLRWLCATVVGAVLTGFAALLLTGRYIHDGPTIVSLTRAHGLHEGDLFVIAGWVVAMVALALLVGALSRVGSRAGRGWTGLEDSRSSRPNDQ